MISIETKEKINDAAQVKDVVADAGIKLVKKGTNYFGCCPFHGEKTASFCVNPITNTWYCFGQCQEGGDAISFVMKNDALTYPEAMRKLARKYNIEIDEQKESDLDKKKRLERESLMLLNERVMKFYAEQLQNSQRPKAYFDERFGEEFVRDNLYGYAPGKRTLYHWAQDTGEDVEKLLNAGLLSRNENGEINDFFNDRVLFPIIDRHNHVLGFSGRTLSSNKDIPKYINTRETDIYHKSKVVFGLRSAVQVARKKEFFYCVEGGPDAARMQSVGIHNTVAALGGSWSADQFNLLLRYVKRVVFINDADPKNPGDTDYAGLQIMTKNCKLALELGLEVSVRELLPYEDGTKCDPGEFFHSPEDLNNSSQLLPEENFVMWYTGRLYKANTNVSEKVKAVKEIAELIALVKDEAMREFLASEVNSTYIKKRVLLNDKINEALLNLKMAKAKENEIDIKKYGFYATEHGYMSEGKTWSNFIMKPLFHIKDEEAPRRLFSLRNYKGETERMELRSDEITSVEKFQQRLGDAGDFIWEGDKKNLTKLLKYLYANTKSARLVKQMGYVPGAGYVFGNGIWIDEFIEADSDGIVSMGDRGNWYIPAASKRDFEFEEKYERERRFVYQKTDVTLARYLRDFCVVFDDNGKVGIAYWISSLFRDIVVTRTRKFPILNLYGPKGTGKTEMGIALMAFFGSGYKAPNIRNSTFAALNNDISLYSNALWHGDEYKNDLHPNMIEFLKGLYDGVGRTKLGGAAFDERTMTRVRCGIILSGQEMPTADIALFTRCLFLEFMNSKFTKQQSNNFNDLFEVNSQGLTHLSVEVLKHRRYFEAHYGDCYEEVIREIREDSDSNTVDTRLIENWGRMAATVKCMESRIDLPFTFREFMVLTKERMLNQSKYCSQQDELARFWRSIAYLADAGFLSNEADFRTSVELSVKTEEYSERLFPEPVRILYLNKTTVLKVYEKEALKSKEKPIALDSLESYLTNSNDFLGHKRSVRFKSIINGVPQMKAGLSGKPEQIYNVRRAMLFNFDEISDKYNIQLLSEDQEKTRPSLGDYEEGVLI